MAQDMLAGERALLLDCFQLGDFHARGAAYAHCSAIVMLVPLPDGRFATTLRMPDFQQRIARAFSPLTGHFRPSASQPFLSPVRRR